MSAILTAFIAFLSIMLPGFFLALALLRKTKLNMFEITVIGFIFGLIFPPAMTWMESYLMDYIHFFSFSAGLYATNVVILTLAGIALSVQQGAISLDFIKQNAAGPNPSSELQKSYKGRLSELRQKISSLDVDLSMVKKHQREEEELAMRHAEELSRMKDMPPEEKSKLEAMHLEEEKKLIEGHEREERLLLQGNKEGAFDTRIIWALLLVFMIFTFATRMMSIGIAPKFFEFDPYFDMQSTEFLISHGYQWLYDRSAWPTAINGTPHRIEPLVPYLEAYWYEISNPPATHIDITLLSNASSFYSPITAALLVFIVFVFLDHTYGKLPAIIGAGLATAMPALITTFIAGEQLLEPWGIFAMFLFYMAYLLAVQDMKDKRLAILAGIAFASSFLGAHYYTVIAGVFAICIVLQGVVDVLRKKEMKDFYTMNAIVIGIIVLFYIVFGPYGSVLTDKIPSVLGIPVVISFPLLSLIIVALFEYGPEIARRYKLIKSVDLLFQILWLAVIAVIALLLILFTPLGKSVTGYLSLSSHFTTPSISLFMTVQEYEPTGFNFDFGSAGFGPIGMSVFGVDVIVWFVLILFTALSILAIYQRDSKASILSMAAIWPLAIAAMIEIKYLPHFGVGYILAFCIIIGELLMLVKKPEKQTQRRMILALGIFVLLLESTVFVGLFSAVGSSCSTISSQGNSIGYDLFCNVVPKSWLEATAWMRQNVGPFAPRILSWWDYGDWINWFGNSNAVLRGDNSIAKLDYMTAARYVLGSKNGYGPENLSSFMNNVVQAKYVLFDDQLTQKWQALNFLACVDVNQTSRAYAIQQANGSTVPYVLGTSSCELDNMPEYILIPVDTNNINNYCQLSNKSVAAVKGLLLVGNNFANETFCVPLNFSKGPVGILDSNGSKTNMLLVPSSQFFAGIANLSGEQFANFMLIYTPNGPNSTVTNAQSNFYSSNYYRGFYLGKLPGFTMVYPKNFTGINYVNGVWPVVIYQVNNYTGTLPNVTAKPAWVQNNFTMPG
jgi:asparagine N-glycosylation enzyme membrane subunit Stt3